MLKIKTTQFGELGLAFHHRTGDPGSELRRILYRANSGDHVQINNDLDVIDKLIENGIEIFVDTRKRYTRAELELHSPVDAPIRSIMMEKGEDPNSIITRVFGEAHVCPFDPYIKEEGRLLSLERAIQSLPNVTDKTRREILSQYHAR